MDPRARQTFLVDSDHIGGRLQAVVARTGPPASGEGARLPVLCVLDAPFNFEIAAASAAWLHTASRLAGGGFPPAVVLGVGYPTDDLREIMARRARDLTPTAGRPPEAVSLPPFSLGAGGAERFLAALTDEVLPAVAARHPADPADRTLIGHSFGGLFALNALLASPSAFKRYLAISPSIWWDRRHVTELEQAWAEAHDDLPARVFVAVGAGEQLPGAGWLNEGFPDEAIAAVRQVANCTDLCARLAGRGYPSLRLECVVLDGEYHLTVQPAAITRGLVALFAADGVGAAEVPDGVASVA